MSLTDGISSSSNFMSTVRMMAFLPVLATFAILLILADVSQVSYAAAVKNTKYPVEAKWGESVRLPCKFDSKEKQFMRWESSSGQVIDTRRQTNFKISDDYALHIRNTTLNEVGQYHCIVRQLKSPHSEERIAADRLGMRVDGLGNVGDGDDPMLKHGRDAATSLAFTWSLMLALVTIALICGLKL